jgi:hypothetical protein
MKNHRLPYGLAYYNLLEEKFEKAEKAWNRYFKRYKTAKTKRKQCNVFGLCVRQGLQAQMIIK